MPKGREFSEQRLLVEWFTMQYPKHRLIVSANGGSRNLIEAVNLKRSGVRSGVPDICLPVPKNGHGALYVELKPTLQKGLPKGVVSENQQAWLDYLNDCGNLAVVCWGFDDAVATISNYLGEGKCRTQ